MANKIKYIINILIIMIIYGLLFEFSYIRGNDAIADSPNVSETLSAIAGIPLVKFDDIFSFDKIIIIKWIMAISIIYILLGKDVYDKLFNLKYLALYRYDSYKKYYNTIINQTIFTSIIYSIFAVLTTYSLYIIQTGQKISYIELGKMGIIFILNIILLSLLQTLCMIYFQDYRAALILLVVWLMIIFCGNFIFKSKWIWLPPEWGMYLRSKYFIKNGVTDYIYVLQVVLCALIWFLSPRLLSKFKRTV